MGYAMNGRNIHHEIGLCIEKEGTMSFGVKMKVWGDYACFTRPEMKVERVSYDVITPSAARAILTGTSHQKRV